MLPAWLSSAHHAMGEKEARMCHSRAEDWLQAQHGRQQPEEAERAQPTAGLYQGRRALLAAAARDLEDERGQGKLFCFFFLAEL